MKKFTNYHLLKPFLLIIPFLCFSFKTNAQICTLTGSGGQNVAGVTTTGGSTNISLSGATAGTANYASINQTVSVDLGNAFNVSVTQANTWSRVLIWIDFNGDDDFEDTGEFFQIGNSSTSNTIDLSTNITIPSSATVGTTTMRIASGDAWSFGDGEPDFGFISPNPCGDYDDIAIKDFSVEIKNPTNIYTGSGSDWATPGNWSLARVPLTTDNVSIPASKTVVISSSTGASANNLTIDVTSTLTVSGGGSLIVSGTSSGNITYNVNIPSTNWHLVSSPVVGEQYDNAWVTANSIASGTNLNRGIATYDNGVPDTDTDGTGTDTATGHWRYFQSGTTKTFEPGVGYSNIRTSTGNYGFTGTFPNADVAPSISQDDQNWNLIGNPYPSYIDIAAFITANTTKFPGAFQAVYVWEATSPTTGSYKDLASGYIHPGQGFFVHSNVANGTVSITEGMQSHQTGITFYKNSNPTINLTISDGTSTKSTQINYLEGKTKGLNPGFDIGLFDGVPSDLSIYTHLVDNNEGISFRRQALPNSDFESMVIPVGVKSKAGKELVFSTEASNLPTGIQVLLEDKVTNTFTRLDEMNSEYKISLTEAINGVGRFYLHTTQSSLSINRMDLNKVRIFESDASSIRIEGLPQGKTTFSLFNILGKQVMTTSFEANAIKNISLPKLATGVYLANIQTETSKINKKIILKE